MTVKEKNTRKLLKKLCFSYDGIIIEKAIKKIKESNYQELINIYKIDF